MPTIEYRNTILRQLDADALDRLHPKPCVLDLRRSLEDAGQKQQHVYFLEDGIASKTTIFGNGTQVEVGMFGREAVIGASLLLGPALCLNGVYMQMAGHGYRVTAANAMAEFERAGQFQRMVLGYLQGQLAQAEQSAGCNGRHSLEQRLARWLLLCRDRADSDTMALTQEFLATMLGCARTAVNTTAQMLQNRGLIEYTRGKVTVLDRDGLEGAACECYSTVRRYIQG
jgi:CRP-like cAMP-binding protein